MSSFDVDTFMNMQTTEANDTSLVPVPVGDFAGSIKAVVPKMAGDKPVLDVQWLITDENVINVTGLKEPTVRQTLWLDLNEGGGLDNGKGKNVAVGKLREALGQNVPGEAWGPAMLIGRVAMLKISHRPGKEPGEVYAQVAAVAAL